MKHINGQMEVGKYYLLYNGTSGFRHIHILKYEGLFTTPHYDQPAIVHNYWSHSYDTAMIFELTDDEIFNNVTIDIITKNL